ncbi:MAG: hypothetical protein ACR2L3_00450 [Actinomycetota bacterium]
MPFDMKKELRDLAPSSRRRLDMVATWERSRQLLWRRRLLTALASAGLITFIVIAAVNVTPLADTNRNGPFSPIESVTDSSEPAASPTDSPSATPSPCITPQDGSYGESPPGKWLRSLLLQIGVPEAPRIEDEEIRDTGTALEVLPAEYSGGFGVYVIAQRPPDPEFSPAPKEVIGHMGESTLYYEEGRPWRGFTAHSEEWQLSLLAYPGPGQTVAWGPNTEAVRDWFSEALSAARQDLPPCG